MLKSVLATMPTYIMSCFHLPNSLSKRIQSALTRFWWDSNSEKKKMSWISWKRMTKSFKTGGLGFRDITTFNRALLAKLCWRILNSSILDSKVKNSASHGWRSICMGRDLLSSRLWKLIGNGSTTPVWRTPWLSLSSHVAQMGPPYKDSHLLVVSDLLLPNSSVWNLKLIRVILPEYEKCILSLHPSYLGAIDRWAWLPTSSGHYTSKSGYFKAIKLEEDLDPFGPRVAPDPFNWKTHIWNLKTSPKTKLLLWKACQNALPVGLNLTHRHITESAKCPFCDADESVLHLLFKCAFAQKRWSLAPFKSPLICASTLSVTEGIASSSKVICLPPSGLGGGPLSPWLLWTIWSSRNQLIKGMTISQSDSILTR
ncbi:putative reverse transcriptase zinc-binding domain-containing protein [Arabidopsis thaliana]